MIRDEIKLSDAPSLSFLYGTSYMMYIGPDLTPDQISQLRANDNIVQVLYLPEIIGQLTVPVMMYNFPGLEFPRDFSVENIYSNIKKEIGYPESSENRLLVRWENGRLIVYDAQDCIGRIISYLSHFGPEPQVFIDEEIYLDKAYANMPPEQCSRSIKLSLDTLPIKLPKSHPLSKAHHKNI